ncbi:nitroreductase family protein [Saccharothrix sp. S26]|uniref:nitroreductase family protein n=1 Tax=Saccharothrix sp. S26 TaxID=2907215 RepID=UPI001F2E6343|nr:nitroreductase family protein [Saccharothrix sp. S26]MCE6995300.1 nitroreductase family protein [Saccharothrix sp. S26]
MTATTSSETTSLLENRFSVRSFRDAPVDDDLVERVLAASTRAPTSFNFQGYALVVVRERARRAALAELIGKSFVAVAPAFVLVCADPGRLWDFGARHDVAVGPQHDDLGLSAVVDASLAGMCLALAAESVGLGTVMVGAVRNRVGAVSALLDLPEGVRVLFGVAIGWTDEVRRPRPRLRPGLVVHRERYSAASRTAAADGELWRPSGEVHDDEVAAWRSEVVRGLRMARRR